MTTRTEAESGAREPSTAFKKARHKDERREERACITSKGWGIGKRDRGGIGCVNNGGGGGRCKRQWQNPHSSTLVKGNV